MNLSQVAQAAVAVFRNAVLGTNVVSLKLAASPGRMIGYVKENLFLYKAYSNSRGLKQANVFDVLGSRERQDIVLGYLQRTAMYGEPWMHELASYTADIVSLCLLCSILKPKTVFEVGTLHGYTAYHFALNSGADTTVYSLDLPKGEKIEPALRTTIVDAAHIGAAFSEYCFSGKPEEQKVRLLFGDSARFDYTPYHDSVDLFFIDGAHSYEYVKSDTLHALRCCKPGGVIAWHDFGRAGVNGVSRWLMELAGSETIYVIPGGSLAFMVKRATS